MNAPLGKLRLVRDSLKEKGLIRTLLNILSYGVDYSFDRRHGTDTFSWVDLDNLGIGDDKRKHAEMYQPTHSAPLRRLLRALQIPKGKVLLDLGSGKGRVLLIASEFGFGEARGVELSPLLCDIASSNCSIYQGRTKTKTHFVIRNSDVLDYKMQDDETVFFLFNPFDAYVLEQVSQSILASLRRRNRTIWIIYRNAVHRQTIEDKMNPTRVMEFVYWGQGFVVFEVDRVATPERGSASLHLPA